MCIIRLEPASNLNYILDSVFNRVPRATWHPKLTYVGRRHEQRNQVRGSCADVEWKLHKPHRASFGLGHWEWQVLLNSYKSISRSSICRHLLSPK